MPRLVFIPFWIMRFILIPLRLIYQVKSGNKQVDRPVRLCIESGTKGWELIEFKELYASACEYIGQDCVYKIVVDREGDYLVQVMQMIDKINPTHYVYSPRTGSQQWINALYQSFRIAVFFTARGITPICILTDVSYRTWRAQSAIVTAITGVVVSFMSPRKFFQIFPHRRLVAPAPMPFSIKTMNLLDEIFTDQTKESPQSAVFAGSIYEPRATILREIQAGLAARGLVLELKGREMDASRSSDIDYWSRLGNAGLVVTTTDQIVMDGMDWAWFPQMVFRYIEATVCGTLLVAPEVPGIRRFFTPDEHFVSFRSPAHAIDVIAYYLVNEKERNIIAQRGKARAQALINARIFWVGIDIALGKDALT